MNDVADTLATGGIRTWDEYKHLTGQIAGLAYAERIFLDTLAENERLENAE